MDEKDYKNEREFLWRDIDMLKSKIVRLGKHHHADGKVVYEE